MPPQAVHVLCTPAVYPPCLMAPMVCPRGSLGPCGCRQGLSSWSQGTGREWSRGMALPDFLPELVMSLPQKSVLQPCPHSSSISKLGNYPLLQDSPSTLGPLTDTCLLLPQSSPKACLGCPHPFPASTSLTLDPVEGSEFQLETNSLMPITPGLNAHSDIFFKYYIFKN